MSVLCLTGPRDDVGLVYLNKEKPRLVLPPQINIRGLKKKASRCPKLVPQGK